jgi:hypothetical protein
VLIINQQMFTTISAKTLAQLEKFKLALISLVETQFNITELISLATRCVTFPAAPPRLLLTRLGQ